jgi:hypothetical protein
MVPIEVSAMMTMTLRHRLSVHRNVGAVVRVEGRAADPMFAAAFRLRAT